MAVRRDQSDCNGHSLLPQDSSSSRSRTGWQPRKAKCPFFSILSLRFCFCCWEKDEYSIIKHIHCLCIVSCVAGPVGCVPRCMIMPWCQVHLRTCTASICTETDGHMHGRTHAHMQHTHTHTKQHTGTHECILHGRCQSSYEDHEDINFNH